MKKLSDYKAFDGVPETFNIFEKDGVCGWSCSRCDKSDVMGNVHIEEVKRIGREFHSACLIKADLVEVENG